MVDKRTVELAKIMFSQGKNKAQIARELNVSGRTIGRYLQYDDDPEFADELREIRRANEVKWVNDAWKISHHALEVAEARLEDLKTSAKDAMLISSIALDKIRMLETTGARNVEETQSVQFIFRVPEVTSGPTHGGPLPVPGEVPQLGSEISLDDRGEGVRQDVLSLLGGCEDITGEPRDPGGDSSIDV